jgi:sortase A
MGRRLLLIAQSTLALGGAASLLYTGAVAARVIVLQTRESRMFNSTAAPDHAAPRHAAAHQKAAREGTVIAELTIPSLSMSSMVVEGVSADSLSVGPGHIPGTALPGQRGNVGIAGHRDTVFRALRKIHANDIVILTTAHQRDRYRVVDTQIVRPVDTRPLYPTARDTLTLVTCYPFYFVGHAPERFVVRAERIR